MRDTQVRLLLRCKPIPDRSVLTATTSLEINLTMKIVLAALLAGSAAAFAPSQQSRASSAVAAKPFADEIGVTAPVS